MIRAWVSQLWSLVFERLEPTDQEHPKAAGSTCFSLCAMRIAEGRLPRRLWGIKVGAMIWTISVGVKVGDFDYG